MPYDYMNDGLTNIRDAFCERIGKMPVWSDPAPLADALPGQVLYST